MTPDTARWRFQTELNRALTTYLHATLFGRTARVLYPLTGRRGRTRLGEVTAWGRVLGVDLGSGPPEERLAGAFRALAELPLAEGEPAPVRIGGWDDARHGAVPALRRARAGLVARLGDTGARLFLHGSYASLDYTGYSDLDTLVILPAAVVTDADALHRCRAAFIASLRPMLAFDALQHHGHFVLTEIDLAAGYPEPIFPRAVLDRCVTMAGGPTTLEVRAVRCRWIARRVFRGYAHGFLGMSVERAERCAYRFKSALSLFMLLPALWCQACGRNVAKKESFPALYEQLPKDAVDVFRRAADIREVWRYRAPPLARFARKVWFNPLLPAALAAARAGPVPAEAHALARGGLLDEAREVVGRLMRMEEEHARQSVA